MSWHVIENKTRQRKLLLMAVISLFTLAFYRTAWVAEDAFITFRVVKNTLDGLGLVWNPGERVQVYTHPLWFGVLLPVVGVVHDPYWASLALSFVFLLLTLVSAGWLLREKPWAGFFALASLTLSKSFIDYSSSGLENPLLHLLLVIFLIEWFCKKNIFCLSFLLSLIFLTRPDAIFLLLPALLMRFWQTKSWKLIFLGSLPAVAWVIFSLFYYGAPVPNTALAKVATGVNLYGRIEQALQYFIWVWDNDPITLAIMTLGCMVGFADRCCRSLALGLLLFLVYLFYVGADYMGGRFLSAPVLLAVLLIGIAGQKLSLSILVISTLIFIKGIFFTLYSPVNFTNSSSIEGVVDERSFYYKNLGLSNVIRQGGWKGHPWFHQGLVKPGVYTKCTIGMTGYASEGDVVWIDPLALAEPFLARLPSRDGARVGHYERAIPEGYIESIYSRSNRIVDPLMNSLYSDVSIAVRGNLWSRERLAAIWRLNTGFHKNAALNYDKNAINLPGIDEVGPSSKWTCYGSGIFWDNVAKIEGSPAHARFLNMTDFLGQ